MKREMFLENEEIAGLAEAVAQVFGLRPNAVVFSVVEQEVEILDPFRDGTRGREASASHHFRKGRFPQFPIELSSRLSWRTLPSWGSAPSTACPMPLNLVRCAEHLDKPDKLQRVIIDDNLAVLEFREPLSGWEAARLVRMLALGWTVEDIIYDEADGTWIVARYGYLQ
jgi:hypothetical protein